MDGTVDLNYQLCGSAVEICDKQDNFAVNF